jgi:putative acetyltransferase
MTRILPAQKVDIPELTSIIGGVFVEYGWIFDAQDEVPDFVAFDTYYVGTEHRLFTVWIGEERVGCIAVKVGPEGPYLSRVYLKKEARGKGIGRMMTEFAFDEARRRGFTHIHLWTDTRLLTAHKMYEATGFTRTPVIRALHEINFSFEYRYDRDL